VRGSRGERQGRTLLVAAAFLAVLVAVVSDLAAGEAALHVASLGLVTGAMAMLRVRLAGRDRGLLQFLSGCVVAQPAVHAAVKLVPHAPLDHGVGTEIGRADVAVTATQLVIALLIVATVSFAEQVLTLVSGVIRVWVLRLRLTVPSAGPVARTCRRTPERAQLSSRFRPVAMRKRGPPLAYAAAA
jgi:hypothetical protein